MGVVWESVTVSPLYIGGVVADVAGHNIGSRFSFQPGTDQGIEYLPRPSKSLAR